MWIVEYVKEIAMEWRDISTAPKDGTRVLIKADCYLVAGFGQVFGTDKVGWLIVNDVWCPDEFVTHWMPLPNPPM